MKKCIQIGFLALIFMAFNSGCQATQKEAEKTDRFERWRIMAENSPKATPDPRPYIEQADREIAETVRQMEEKQHAPEASDSDDVPEKALPKMRLTMKMHDVPVAVLLRTLARAADVNILINETVSGQAKINIVNVPWDEAFLGLLGTYGLTYKWSGDILRVVTVEDLNREIALMEAKQKYQKSKKEHVLAMQEIARKQEQLEPLVTRVVKINFSDLDELRENLEKYLVTNSKEAALKKSVTEGSGKKGESGSEIDFRGSILKDKNTNSLIVNATRSDLDKILPLIRKIDQPSRQVLIEAHIVEATSDTARELGVQWGGLGIGTNSDGSKSTTGMLGTSAFTTEENDAGENELNMVSSFLQDAAEATASSGGLSFGMLTQKVGDWMLYTELTALEQEGKVNILSKPSITTLDHHTASIESGKDVPFQTVEDGEVSIEWRKAVISLEVTPHVIDDNIVRLEILTHKDELDFTNTVDGNPTITTKNAETMVNLFDGQTTVIGGLNKENLEESESGVPYLKDVPGLGWLFKTQGNSSEMEELLIFITPHILKGRTVDEAAAASASEKTVE